MYYLLCVIWYVLLGYFTFKHFQLFIIYLFHATFYSVQLFDFSSLFPKFNYCLKLVYLLLIADCLPALSLCMIATC